MTKVVEGSDVNFAQTEQETDKLEDVVQETEEPQEESLIMSEQDRQLMSYLGVKLIEVVKQYGNKIKDRHTGRKQRTRIDISGLGDISELLPYCLHIRKLKQESWGYQGETSTSCYLDIIFRPDEFKCFLETRYGDGVAQSGLFERLNVNGNYDLDFETVSEYFPEVECLRPLITNPIPLKNSPYQALLMVPVEGRAFLTGAISEYHGDSNRNNDNKMHCPLRFGELLEYAQQNDQEEHAAMFYDMYLGKIKSNQRNLPGLWGMIRGIF